MNRTRTAIITALTIAVFLAAGAARAQTQTWTGNVNSDWHTPGNWDGNAVPGAGETALIPSNTVVLGASTADLAALTLNGGTLTFSNWTTRLTATDVTVSNGTITTAGPFNSYTNQYWPAWIPSNRVSIACSNLTVGANAVIDVSGQGYLGGFYDNALNIFIAAHGPDGPAAGRLIGGSHAAPGGKAAADTVYGDPLQPTQPGSGGGVEWGVRSDPVEPGQAKGHGGGVIEILASGTVTVDGEIKADGREGTYSCAGGAGGSILIECASILGSGRVSAKGERSTSTGSASGSGGRISVQYDSGAQAAVAVPGLVFSADSIPTRVGYYDHVQNSRIGTLCFPDNRLLVSPVVHDGVWIATNAPSAMAFDSLEVGGVWFQLANDGVALTVTNELSVHGTGRLELSNAVVSCDTLTVTNFGIFELLQQGTARPSLTVDADCTMVDDSYVKICAGPTNATEQYGALVDIKGTLSISDNAWMIPVSQPTEGGSPKFQVRNAEIASGAGFDGNGTGYRNVEGTPYGPGAATGTWGGGGYGGAGGGNNGGPTYGSSNAPVQCGSAGGGSATYGTGHGGGLIWLDVTGILTLNGVLTANGTDGGGYGSGGSGGGIYLHCNDFDGNGSLTADGGFGGDRHNSTAGGGGGRIHVARVKDLGNTVTTSVLGKGRVSAPTSNTGGVGTVLWTWLPPVDADIEMRPATNVTATGASLNGYLFTTGASETVVSVYWGETDGQTDAAAWANTNVLAGAAEPGWVTETVTLDPGREYYYRYAAANDAGFVWAEEDSEYLITDGITLAFSPAAISEAGAVATATVSRAASVTSSPMTVYYTISGTASNGDDYTTIADHVTIAAGASNATVVLTTIPDALSEDDKSLILTLEEGRNFAVGTPSTATLTIENASIAAGNTSVADGDWHDTATWSEGHIPVTPQEIVVTNDIVLTRDTEQLTSLTLDGGTMTFTNWTTTLHASNVVLNDGALTCAGPFNSYVNEVWPTLDPSNRVRIVCADLFVGTNATIDVDAKGYRGGISVAGDPVVYHPGHGPGGDTRYRGATHAAIGGAGNTKAPYGDPLRPTTPGSGGGGSGGHGGGAIEIVASGTVTVDGEVTADGVRDMADYWGSGAGGSIYVACRRIAGSGELTAEGGMQDSWIAGSGSGGRISVQYDPGVQATAPVPSLSLSARSILGHEREYDHPNDSRIGTVCVPDDRLLTSPVRHSGVWIATNPPAAMHYASLEVGDVWLQIPRDGTTLTVTNELRVHSNGRLEVTNAMVACGSLTVTNFGIVELYRGTAPGMTVNVAGDAVLADDSYWTICAPPTNGVAAYGALVAIGGELNVSDNAWVIPESAPLNGGSVKFEVGDVAIAAGAGFDAEAAGYGTVDLTAYGPGRATGPWGGGGYGGYGGRYPEYGGATYGSSNAPVQCGSAGGNGGGYGGGLIWLEVAGLVHLDGVLNANGGTLSTYNSGGSGGGIYVTCRKFGGSGSLTADGGNGGADDRTSGGGGGRICVARVRDEGNAVSASVSGGHDSETPTVYPGEDGTVVWTWLPPSGTLIWLR